MIFFVGIQITILLMSCKVVYGKPVQCAFSMICPHCPYKNQAGTLIKQYRCHNFGLWRSVNIQNLLVTRTKYMCQRGRTKKTKTNTKLNGKLSGYIDWLNQKLLCVIVWNTTRIRMYKEEKNWYKQKFSFCFFISRNFVNSIKH